MANNGILYLRIIHPGHISLEIKKWFIFSYKNTRAAFSIESHIEATNIINFNFKVSEWPKFSDFSTLSNHALHMNYQVGSLKYDKSLILDHSLEKIVSSSCYTIVILAFESYLERKYYKYEQEFDLILDSFLDKYKVLARDIYIRTLSKSPTELYYVTRYFYEYSPDERKLSFKSCLEKIKEIKTSLSTLKFHNLIESVPFRTPEEVEQISRNLTLLLSNDSLLEDLKPKEQIFIIEQELFVQKNYKFALLQAFIFCETIISEFLYKKKIAAGVSKNKLKDLEKEIPISYMIGIELPCFIKCDKKDRELLGEVDRIRNLRNSVVHRGSHVSEKDAKDALNALVNLQALLSKN